MDLRTTCTSVTFSHPFKLIGVEDVQPAGTYTVETCEELLPVHSLHAYRRVSTQLRLMGRAGSTELSRVVTLEPAELVDALARDARPIAPMPPTAEAAAVEGPRLTAGPKRYVLRAWKAWIARCVTAVTRSALGSASFLLATLLS